MARVSKDEFEQLRGELTIRKGGKLPHLPDELDDPEGLRDWLTLAFRPPEGWRVVGFERAGRDQTDKPLLPSVVSLCPKEKVRLQGFRSRLQEPE